MKPEICKIQLYDCRPPKPLALTVDEYLKLLKINTKEAIRKANELYPGYNFSTKIHYTKQIYEKAFLYKRYVDSFAIYSLKQYWYLYKLFSEINTN